MTDKDYTISEWNGHALPPVEGHRWVLFGGEPALKGAGEGYVGWINRRRTPTQWEAIKSCVPPLSACYATADEAIAVLAMWVTLGVEA
jgi:hypothetical protein